MKTKSFKLIILISLICQLSCSLLFPPECEDGEEKQPSNCETSSPSHGSVSILISNNSMNSIIPVKIYKGNVEDGELVVSENLTSGKTYTLPNGYYSAKAEYKSNYQGEVITVFAIDGKTLDYSSKSYCDGDCYEKGSINLDLELAF